MPKGRLFCILLRRKVFQYFGFVYRYNALKRLKNQNFAIVSNNCWGGQIYLWLKKPFNTPFVGLFLYGPCYLKLVKNIDYYLKQKLEFVDYSRYPDRKKTYPVGVLDDIEIHFTHYKNEKEALEKWTRRTVRFLSVRRENMRYMICDRERVTKGLIEDFNSIVTQNKVSFAAFECSDNTHIRVYQRPKNSSFQSPNGKQLFKLSFLYFDIIQWLNGGQVIRTYYKS